ncbi:MAG TPA: inositol monophosphatase family protein [Allosphingosinicella sp.]|jgi:myo-inositol-1(or 4)-monophosphatase
MTEAAGPLPDFAAFARLLADAARRETLDRAGFSVENKLGEAGWDPVTEADRGAERVIRQLIEYRYPSHGIVGEEFPDRPAQSPWSWSLDPVDGTRAYVCGLPSWTTLIALLDAGEPVLGLVDVPRVGERYIGYGGTAVLVQGKEERALRVSGCRSLCEARFATTDPYMFHGADRERFERLRDQAQVTRFGWDAYAYARVAAGTIDLVVEAGLKPHDYNALVPLVRAAGGVVSNWQGGDRLDEGKIVAAASRELLDEACALLA